MFRSLALLLACASTVCAATVPLTLENIGSYASKHNPSLAAARFRIEEARGRLQQSGRLSNPEVATEFMQNARTSGRSFELAFTQRFPVTARLRLEKAVSRAEVAAAEAEVRDQERRLALAVRTLAVRLVSIENHQALRERQLENSRELVEFTRKRLESAEAAPVDVLQLELEGRQLEAEILQLDTDRAVLIGELRPQLGLGPADVPVVRGSLPVPARIPAPAGAFARPDLEGARATVDAARSAAALARAQKWEDIGVGIVAQTERAEDAPEGFMRDDFIGFRLSVPLPLWNDNSGRVREAEAAAARRAREVDVLTLNIRGEIEAARGEMATIAKLVSTLDEALLPAAAQIEDRFALATRPARRRSPTSYGHATGACNWNGSASTRSVIITSPAPATKRQSAAPAARKSAAGASSHHPKP